MSRYNKEDSKAHDALAKIFTGESATVVQVGAADGVLEDPFYMHLQYATNCWVKGVYFECNPDLSRICRKNLAAWDTGITVQQMAISSYDGEVDYWYVPGQTLYRKLSNRLLLLGCGGIGAMPRELDHHDVLPHVKKSIVQCLKWATACQRFCIDQIDALSIDTEGHDVTVAEQIDFLKHGIQWATIEMRHVRQEVYIPYIEATEKRFGDHYDFVAGRYDFYVIRKGLL